MGIKTLPRYLSNLSEHIARTLEPQLRNIVDYLYIQIDYSDSSMIKLLTDIKMTTASIRFKDPMDYEIFCELTANLSKNLKVDFYTDRNISDLVDNIFLFDAVIVGSEAGRNLVINSNLSRKEVLDYVNLGGSLLIFGQNIGGYGWMRNFGIVEWKDIEKSMPLGIILLYRGAMTLGKGLQITGAYMDSK